MNVRTVIALLASTLLAACAHSAEQMQSVAPSTTQATPATPTTNCATLRDYVHRFGEALVISQARAQGYSEKQIETVRKACK